MAKFDSWIKETKIKPYKMPRLLKEPKEEKLVIAIKSPVKRKSPILRVKFTKI